MRGVSNAATFRLAAASCGAKLPRPPSVFLYSQRDCSRAEMSSYASQKERQIAPAAPVGARVIYRHTLLVRVTHWINAICFVLLLMSGLQIFNAYPALNWGARSDFDKPILFLHAQ